MITKQIREFKKMLKGGHVVGPFSKTLDPAFIEIMGHAGCDFVILDLEHGPNSVETVQGLIRAAQVANLFPIVRVKGKDSSTIGEVLDIGAGGIHVPQITDAKAANHVMQLAKFAPDGMRGVCRFVRAAGYSSQDRFQYFEEANEAVIVLGLEGTEALENVDEIIAVEGIDIIFVGPYDLSQSLGITGQIDDPLVAEEMKKIVDKCVSKGVAVGTFVETIESAKKWRDLGVKYLCYSVDMGIFHDACQEIIYQINSAR
jgi:4-hydroxy-2-oxoheptanedioate aldolase